MRLLTARIRRPARHGWQLIRRCVAEDDGQDLVEYALLAAFFAVTGWAILQALPETMRLTYESWVSEDSGVPALWDPPEPTGGGS